MKRRGFKILKHRSLYRGRAVNLAVDRLRLPNGAVLEREILYHPGSSVIIPRLGKDSFLLVRQFRYAVRNWLWEFPAGTLEPGETPLHCARRELEEETGYRAHSFRPIACFYPSPGVSNERMHLYLATRLRKTRPSPEEDELLEVRTFRFAELKRMARSGRIRDGKTLLGLYLCLARRG
jgi:ADP-ribose pyrophosphatase